MGLLLNTDSNIISSASARHIFVQIPEMCKFHGYYMIYVKIGKDVVRTPLSSTRRDIIIYSKQIGKANVRYKGLKFLI